ncbi:hypothetical protein FACS1894153_2870 [Bacteroidia bacterium]|nr:hypothetical protein FACS1894153_2870 [Bacteroidia bacterium]
MKISNFIKQYGLIVLGSFIVAAAYVFFITPYKIIPGGVYGIAIVLHYISAGWFDFLPEGLPIGLTALCFNIPLAYFAFRLLGGKAKAIPRTITTFVSTSIFTDLFSYFFDNHQLATGDSLLASIYGGVLIGIGVTMIFKAKATSAGTDVIARIVSKYIKIPIGLSIIIIDSIVVLIGLIAFGEWAVPLYSWITIFVYGKVVDAFQLGLKHSKAVFIISPKHKEIGEMINQKLNRGGTFFHGKGIYSGQETNIVYTVVSSRQVPSLREKILEIDSNAFITVMSANETFGNGFINLKETLSE